jgi:E1A/CREB-binding protein
MQASQNAPGNAQPLVGPPQSIQTFAQPQYPQQQQQQQIQQQQAVAPVTMQLPQQASLLKNFAPAPQQVQVQQQQHSMPQQGLNGGWQSDKDYQERRKMIGKIVLLLQQRKPNAPQEWLKKLPQMAKRLEESLYRSATSFAEYNDVNTLKQRLQQLAVNIGMKSKKMQQAQMLQQQKQLQQQGVQQLQQPQQLQFPLQQVSQPVSAQPQQLQQQTSQPLAGQEQQQQLLQSQPQVLARPQQVMPIQQVGIQVNPQQRIVNMSDINPMIAAPAPQPVVPQQQAPQQNSFGIQQQPQQPQALGAPQAPPSGAPAADANGTRQVSDRQQVLRHQQQRLLLLRHAAKCQHEDNKCPVTPHCAGMKRLWKHIAECKNQKCLVPHCVSSRYVLSHYHRCKDVRCPVCGPVREAIHRSHEKQKHMQALKQRHQQAVQQTSGQQVQGSATAAGASAVTTSNGVPTTLSLEPANKRHKTGAIPAVSNAIQMQARPLSQPNTVPSVVGVPQPSSSLSRPVMPSSMGSGIVGLPAQPHVAPVPGLAFSNGQVIMPKTVGPKPQEDHTLINCFSVEQIELHIASLNNGLVLPPLKLKTKALEALKVLQSHQHAWVFNSPVDPVELGLPDYFQVIKHPMDLGTVRKKLENGLYTKLEQFEEHVNLTFDNAMLYNPEGSVVYNMASEMKSQFASDFAKLMAQLNAEEDVKRKNGEACLLCGCEKLLFEPPVFYCNGLNCPSKRIRRNSHYYVAGNNQYHWCHLCFQELKDNTTLDLGDISVKKEQLVKKKNDDVHEESWVQCDRCERWVHQICALFNTRQNKDQRSEYACPKCTIEERKKSGNLEATSTTPMAEDLPRTLLSEYLENHVRTKVEEFIEKQSMEKAARERIPLEEARKKLQMGGAITIRQVTSMDRKLEVRERMKARYAYKNYPEEFSFRCKCIVVFQNLDGVDVMLFGLYVYEHDEKNPPPNTRTVYISYLDSVHYMRPRQMRTFIYHEILISYLDYVRKRGYATAHIWACPPLKGDDYILYAKPEDQKVPKDDRLRMWYVEMLVECQRRGIVGRLTNMYDLYFSDPKCDATIVPYMDGDYFPAEVENIIKDIEDGKAGKKSSSKASNKTENNKAKQKKKTGRQGTRSAGLDEDALRASGMVPTGSDSRSVEQGARDYVMVKLGEIIQPMKESFIVAYLAWEDASEENMIVPKEIQEHREANGITWKIEAKARKNVEVAPVAEEIQSGAGNSICDNGGEVINGASDVYDVAPSNPVELLEKESQLKAETTPLEVSPDATVSESISVDVERHDSNAGNNENVPESVAMSTDPPSVNDPKSAMSGEPSAASSGQTETNCEVAIDNTPSPVVPPQSMPISNGEIEAAGKQQNITVPAEVMNDQPASTDTSFLNITVSEPPKAENTDSAKQQVNMAIREGKFSAMEKRKRALDEDSKENSGGGDAKPSAESKSLTVKDSKGRLVKVLDDDEEELDCEFLNNRQAFLNLCQGNHYQFDVIRRAKHSSMMVLWHLHNRDAPKFVQQCATCSREILSGYRLHCPTCADFDQCQDCYQNPKIARHPHQLKPVAIASTQQTELTEAQRKERQRSIQLHMTLLLHAATCTSADCPSANCTKMKGLLKHGSQCQVKAAGGCNVCKRIWALLQIHARQCKTKICRVPNCMAIRERVRQLKQQQQAMDDRRRQEMNRAYRGKR